MKKIIYLVIMICFSQISTSQEKLTFEKLRVELTTYLLQHGEMLRSEVEDYKNGERQINLIGVHNNFAKGGLINGVYSFSLTRTMARGYFVIVDNSEYTILDITTRDGLDKSIKLLLDFCDKYNYCETIVTDYVGRLTRVYYNLNKWKGQRTDLNCEEGRGIIDTKSLP